MKIVFARHGETDWNVGRLIQGHHDIPLNARGREQAAMLAETIKYLGITRAYASDLQRAVETARIATAPLGLSVTADARLRECHFGTLDGQPYAVGRTHDKTHPHNHPEWPDPLACDFSHLGGESGASLFARQLAALQDFQAAHPDEMILVVGHGRSLRVLLHGLGQPQPHFGNCEYFVVPFDHEKFRP